MGDTTIEWTEQTWNPVRGCSPVSPGCKQCYAERVAGRFCGPGKPFEGFVQIGKNGDSGPHWTGRVELQPHMLDIPLKRRKPTTYFVNSMSDLFHENLKPKDRRRVFDFMRGAPQHTYQILTKRADIMVEFGRWWCMQHAESVMPSNWWFGVSVEDRDRKFRIDDLRETPATVRFLSLEPLLEDLGTLDLRGIHWVIVGGESGPGARPMHPDWVRSIRDQCVAAGVPFFFKQWGGFHPAEIVEKGTRTTRRGETYQSVTYSLPSYCGMKWGAVAHVGRYGMLDPDKTTMINVGKKRAGRLLDGREWNQMPEVAHADL